MKRIVSIFIILVFAGQSWAAVGLKANSGLFQIASADDPPGLKYSMEDGIRDGEMAGERRPSSSTVAGGIACGVLGGLICTGILWAMTGPDPVPLRYQAKAEGKGEEYYNGFVYGYEKRTKEKKRGARLGGGLLGTAAFVALYISATAD